MICITEDTHKRYDDQPVFSTTSSQARTHFFVFYYEKHAFHMDKQVYGEKISLILPTRSQIVAKLT